MNDQKNSPLRNDEVFSMNRLSRAQVESIARWIGTVTSHPNATVEQLDALYEFVSTAPMEEVAETAQSLGY